MRIISFDAGSKRIGVAVSDESQTIATGVGYIDNDDKLDESIAKLMREYKPIKIVIGNPINMDGSKNNKKDFVDSLVVKLKDAIPGEELVMWDERLTTMQAERVLIKGNVRRKDRKKHVDKLAAALTLQNYLDYLKNTRQ